MGRRFPAAVAVALTAALVLSFSASSASSSQEADFVSRINAERSSQGLSTLVAKTDLADVARAWSQHMAAQGSISHDPNLPYKVSGWTVLGDNVGKGPTVSAIHKAFMESDTHRHIILDTDFNQVGVGVVKAGSVFYVTQVFARRVGGGSSTTPKPKPKAAAPYVAPVVHVVAGVTGRIWSVELTAPPVTVDMLMQLIALDAA